MSLRLHRALAAAGVLGFAASLNAQLIITEVVDATLFGGQPKYVTLTNIGADIADLSIYSLGNMNNGGTTLGGGSSTQLNAVPLLSGASYNFAYESPGNTGCDPAMLVTCFEFVYGQPADQYTGRFTNGDDVYLLFLGNATGLADDATIVDIYGFIGVDGTGTAWEYTDGYAQRCTEVIDGSSVMLECQWVFGGVDSLQDPGGDDVVELALIQSLTSPFAHDTVCGVGAGGLWDCLPPTFCSPTLSSDGCTVSLLKLGPTNMPVIGANNWGILGPAVQGGSNAIFFVSFSGQWTAPFQNGTLCVRPPVGRSPIQNAGGTLDNCDGAIFLVMNAPTAPWGPFVNSGDYMWVQMWYRDSGGVPFDTQLSNAMMIQFQ